MRKMRNQRVKLNGKRKWIGMALSGAVCATLSLALASSDPGRQDPTTQSQDEIKTMLAVEIGKPAPQFSLKDQEGNAHYLSDYKGKIIVLEWFHPDCEETQRLHGEKGWLRTYANEFNQDESQVWFAVNTSGRDEAGWGEKVNREAQQTFGIEFPILLDEYGAIARLYHAKKVPTIVVIDKEGIVRYMGAVDDDPEGKKAESGETVIQYVKDAIDAVRAGVEVTNEKSKPYGCKIELLEKSSRGG